MNKSLEEVGIDFMSDEESPLIEHAADCSFDFPSLQITAETSPVLTRWFLAVAAVRRDLFNAPLLERITKPVGVGCLVVKEALGSVARYLDIHQSFNRVHFGILSGRCKCGNRATLPIRHQHDFCSLTFLRLTNLKTPLFLRAKTCRHRLPVTSPATSADPEFSKVAPMLSRSARTPSIACVSASKWQKRDNGLVNLSIEHRSSAPKEFPPSTGARQFWGGLLQGMDQDFQTGL
jgi:hypothetical protein